DPATQRAHAPGVRRQARQTRALAFRRLPAARRAGWRGSPGFLTKAKLRQPRGGDVMGACDLPKVDARARFPPPAQAVSGSPLRRIGRRSQVVRRSSAKALFPSSSLGVASSLLQRGLLAIPRNAALT